MVFVQNSPVLQHFLRQDRPEKCFLWYSSKKETPLKAIKTISPKSRQIDIFLERLTHSFAPKLAIFPFFFLGNIGLENVFYDILERKSAFLDYKNKKSKNALLFYKNKKSKNLKKLTFFKKRLTHGFCPK